MPIWGQHRFKDQDSPFAKDKVTVTLLHILKGWRQRHWGTPQSKQSSFQFSSVAKSCPTVCDPMDCSVPSFPVLHHLKLTSIVSDAIQLSQPLSSPLPTSKSALTDTCDLWTDCLKQSRTEKEMSLPPILNPPPLSVLLSWSPWPAGLWASAFCLLTRTPAISPPCQVHGLLAAWDSEVWSCWLAPWPRPLSVGLELSQPGLIPQPDHKSSGCLWNSSRPFKANHDI